MKLLPSVLLLALASQAFGLPSFEEVKKNRELSDAVLLDRHGVVIHELRVDPGGRRLEWTGLKEMPPFLLKAVVHSEDKRFYEHGGVDWKAAGAAALRNVLQREKRGASTITMQLASMLRKDLRPKGARRTLAQKWDQMKEARDLDRSWTKDQILEAYLNLVFFRGELQGLAAASRGLFDKAPHGLDEAESLLLAALIRSPNTSSETAAVRACTLAGPAGASAACDDIKALSARTLTGRYYVRQRAALAPHVAHTLLSKGSSRVSSTLDADLQRFTGEALRRHLAAVRSQNVSEGAVLVADNITGDILAYVGNAGGDAGTRYVDGVLARRQAGSTLKPFLYALAFENRILTPASLLSDSPVDVPTATGIYKPENYETDFKGMVSARTALASSLNIPAVRVIGLTGTGPFVQRLHEAGFRQLEPDEYYGQSIALGSADVTLYELVNAYRVLANKGVWTSLRMTPVAKTVPRRRVFSGEAAFLVSDILSDREARSTTFGLESSLSTRYWSAVKTGTSKDMRDNWCIGYSGRYTVGVWVGNFSGRPMWNVSGVTGAAPVWLEIMDRLHRSRPSGPPPMPASVVSSDVDYPGGAETPRREVFSRGTEHHVIEADTPHEIPKIIYPADGTILAVDPDIPEGHQLVWFDARGMTGGLSWLLDNLPLGTVSSAMPWEPAAGRHVLALVDDHARVVDEIRFEVRGGGTGLPEGGMRPIIEDAK